MPTHDAAIQLRVGHMFQASVLLIPYAERMHQRQTSRLARLAEPPPDRFEHALRNGVAAAGASDSYGHSVADQARGIVRRHDGLFEGRSHDRHLPRKTG